MPVAASDQEGMYEGLQWAVRALEECGRAFTRVTRKVNKVESRLGAVEGAIADVGARLRRLEERGAAPPVAPAPAAPAPAAAPAPVMPLRVESQLINLRKDVAGVLARMARLEAAPSPPPSPGPPPPEPGHRMVALTARVGALEGDIQGLYRELDRVAELVSDRFEALAQRLDGPLKEDDGNTTEVRAKAATVLIGELERISHALGVLNEAES